MEYENKYVWLIPGEYGVVPEFKPGELDFQPDIDTTVDLKKLPGYHRNNSDSHNKGLMAEASRIKEMERHNLILAFRAKKAMDAYASINQLLQDGWEPVRETRMRGHALILLRRPKS